MVKNKNINYGNAIAGVLFFVLAILNFTKDESGMGITFLTLGAVFISTAKKK